VAQIECERVGSCAIIRLNRPDKLNALTLAMREQLLGHLTRLDRDDTIRAVILTGAGERAFCAGADLDEVQARTVETELAPDAALRRQIPTRLETMRQPTIAALHGYVLGAGLELALACTFRVAERTARLGLPEVVRGVIPGSGGTQRLARLIGVPWALELVLTGEPISAEEAWRIGLVTRLTLPGRALAEALALAEHIAALPPYAVTLAKHAVLYPVRRGLDADLEAERWLFALALHHRSTSGPGDGTGFRVP